MIQVVKARLLSPCQHILEILSREVGDQVRFHCLPRLLGPLSLQHRVRQSFFHFHVTDTVKNPFPLVPEECHGSSFDRTVRPFHGKRPRFFHPMHRTEFFPVASAGSQLENRTVSRFRNRLPVTGNRADRQGCRSTFITELGPVSIFVTLGQTGRCLDIQSLHTEGHVFLLHHSDHFTDHLANADTHRSEHQRIIFPGHFHRFQPDTGVRFLYPERHPASAGHRKLQQVPRSFHRCRQDHLPLAARRNDGKLLPAQNLFPIHLNGLVISAFINTDLRGSCLQVFLCIKRCCQRKQHQAPPFSAQKQFHACLIYMFQKCFFSTFSDTATGSPDGVSGYELFFRLHSMDICV